MDYINTFLSKISSYNIFSNLLPGLLYYHLVQDLTSFVFQIDNVFIMIFVCYFIGLVIGRIGSLIIETLLKKEYKGKAFLNFANYSDYIDASSNNDFIKELNETNNTYRNLLSCFLLLLLTKIYELTLWKWFENNDCAIDIQIILLCVLLVVLFLFSYKKQTNYITKRVNHYISNKYEREE